MLKLPLRVLGRYRIPVAFVCGVRRDGELRQALLVGPYYLQSRYKTPMMLLVANKVPSIGHREYLVLIYWMCIPLVAWPSGLGSVICPCKISRNSA